MAKAVRNGNVTWAQLLRCIIYGIVFIVSVSGGLVAWTVTKTEAAATTRTKVEYNVKRIDRIEVQLDKIESKIDRILERCNTN